MLPLFCWRFILTRSVTEMNSTDARKEALGKLRLITDRIMLRRVKRDHTAAMELPPKRLVFWFVWLFCRYLLTVTCLLKTYVKSCFKTETSGAAIWTGVDYQKFKRNSEIFKLH